MNKTRKPGVWLGLLGIVCIVLSILMLQIMPAVAKGEGTVKLPNDIAYWFHNHTQIIRKEAAEALKLDVKTFGDTYYDTYMNTIALNDIRSGTRPFRDGASFVIPFHDIANPVADLETDGNLRFTAVMVKDSVLYKDTGGWGFEAFTPDGKGITGGGTSAKAACFACHEQAVAKNDFVFESVSERPITAVPASDNGVFLPYAYRGALYHMGSKLIGPKAAAALGFPAGLIDNSFDDVYANPAALDAYNSGTRPWPEGTLFVADFHKVVDPPPVAGLVAEGDIIFTAVMLKAGPGQGDDPSTGDWKFEAFDGAGKPLKDIRSACISCHASQKDNDFAFSKKVQQ